MKDRRGGIGVILLILVAAALGTLIYLRLVRKPPEGTSIEKIEKQEGMAVNTEKPVRRDFVEYVTCDAAVDAETRYMLRASIGGVVEKVNADVGDAVTKDQLLVEFRKTDLEARVAAARAAHEEAEANLARYRVLLEKGGVSQNMVEARKTACESTAAALRLAESQLAFAEIRSPVGGDVRVEARYVEPGEEKGVGKELLSLVDLSRLEVKASVPESAVPFVREGGAVEFRLEGDAGWRAGTIARISPSTSHPNRFFDVFVPVENEKKGAGWVMRPGMYARVRVPVGERKSAVAVSAGAVKRKSGREYVFVIDDTEKKRPVAAQVTVETGLRQEGYVQIVRGDVDEGSVVVSTPRDTLKDGDRVKPAGR